jgi:hypothetical protein
MRRHRTTARGKFLALLAASLVAAAASPQAGSGESAGQGVPRFVFPLVAQTELWDNYGDARPNGSHEGIDMENPWRAPVVAVEPGKIDYHDSGLGGCMLYLYGRSGTMYMYIHLNDDLTARYDNRGGCKQGVAFAVPDGARVSAGQQIAWNGDSGDAQGNHHLHFEVHPGGGAATNPYPYLKRAPRPLFAARLGSVFSLGLRGDLVARGTAAVKVAVEQVRYYPGGNWLTIEPRTLELEKATPVRLRGVTRIVQSSPSRVLERPVPVVAFTPKAQVTTAAITGAAGSLRLQRIVRR